MEVILCDEILNTLPVIIWSRSLIEFVVAHLQIGNSVLVCPARLKSDPFRGGKLIASTLTKSIVTIEPNLDDARFLKRSIEDSNIIETVQQMISSEEEFKSGELVTPALSSITGYGIIGFYLRFFSLSGVNSRSRT